MKRLKGSIRTAVFAAVGTILTMCAFTSAAPPDTIYVPVTIYDYHSDYSNPEFQPPNPGEVLFGVKPNLVADKLDADFKPVKGTETYMTLGIGKWFRPWATGDFMAPSYSGEGYVNGTMQQADHDTSFKNVVINDTLRFIQGAKGQYKFITVQFDPISGQGFGNEYIEYSSSGATGTYVYKNTENNLSFAMEMAIDFVYAAGEFLYLIADDDCWAFIDNTLVLDIGGMHAPEAKMINLNEIAGMTFEEGKTYTLRVFYAERCSAGGGFNMIFNGFYPELISGGTGIAARNTIASSTRTSLNALYGNGGISFDVPFGGSSVVRLFHANGVLEKVMYVDGKGRYTIASGAKHGMRLLQASSSEGMLTQQVLLH